MAAKSTKLVVEALFKDFETTVTKSGWCLKAGLQHVASKDPKIFELIQQHGIPTFYSCCGSSARNKCRHAPTQDFKDPVDSFQSLCRTIVGQCVAGVAARKIYERLLHATQNNLTPETVLELFQNDPEGARKQIGLSKTKANSIIDLATHFSTGRLSESILYSNKVSSNHSGSNNNGTSESNVDAIRKALLAVKGIGPWSCDMFLQFYLEESNILPLGDLGVRNGIQKCFGLKDHDQIIAYFASFAPYQSLVTYYMWRVADTPKQSTSKATSTTRTSKKRKAETTAILSPKASGKQKRLRNIVTPWELHVSSYL